MKKILKLIDEKTILCVVQRSVRYRSSFSITGTDQGQKFKPQWRNKMGKDPEEVNKLGIPV